MNWVRERRGALQAGVMKQTSHLRSGPLLQVIGPSSSAPQTSFKAANSCESGS